MKIRVADVARTGLLAGLALALQAMNLPQPVTGPGVNAVLFVSSIFVGPLAGVFVGAITPWVGLMTGIVKLAPAVPVIIAGNVTLSLASGYLRKYNRYLAMAVASVLKYGVMTLGVKYLISTGTKIPAAAYASMTITQLFTAFGGAVVAAAVLAALMREKR
ncbi:MAG: ECF transporter S component [Bacillota bacterium]